MNLLENYMMGSEFKNGTAFKLENEWHDRLFIKVVDGKIYQISQTDYVNSPLKVELDSPNM